MTQTHDKKQRIIEVATKMAETMSYAAITRDELAKLAEVSGGLVTHYFNPFSDIIGAIIEHAFATDNMLVLRQAVANGHVHPAELTAEMRNQILKSYL